MNPGTTTRTVRHRSWLHGRHRNLGAILLVAACSGSQTLAQKLEFPRSVPFATREARFPEEQYPRGPYITADQYEDWLIEARIWLRAQSDNFTDSNFPQLRYQLLDFDQLTLDWPVFRRGGSHIVAHDDIRIDFEMNGQRPPKSTTVLSGPGTITNSLRPQPAVSYVPPVLFQSASLVARYEGPAVEARVLRVNVDIPVRAWETIYHEQPANQVPWPEGPWPHEAQATFVPQSYIDTTPTGATADLQPIRELLDGWLNGNKPTDTTPALLAKFLAGRVQEHVEISNVPFVTVGDSRADISAGYVAGLNVGSPSETAARGFGTPWDLVNLLCAVYRMAGIPARTVYGLRSNVRDEQPVGQSSFEPVHAWVEFCLFDEKNQTVNWVPVDIIQLQENSNKAYDLNVPWDYFGNHRHLDDYVPFAMHLLPPTPAAGYGAPGFIAIMPEPGKAPGVLYTDVRFTLSEHSRTSQGTPSSRAFNNERW